MIVQGNFTTVTLSVYGSTHPASTSGPMKLSFDARPLNPLQPSPSLDVLSLYDPTLPARQLLALVENPPQLATVIRLIFCIKPRKGDWHAKAFPFYQSLENSRFVDARQMVEVLSKPISEDATGANVQRFCNRVLDIWV